MQFDPLIEKKNMQVNVFSSSPMKTIQALLNKKNSHLTYEMHAKTGLFYNIPKAGSTNILRFKSQY